MLTGTKHCSGTANRSDRRVEYSGVLLAQLVELPLGSVKNSLSLEQLKLLWSCLLRQQLCVLTAIVKLQTLAQRGNLISSFPFFLVPFPLVSFVLFASDLVAFVALE